MDTDQLKYLGFASMEEMEEMIAWNKECKEIEERVYEEIRQNRIAKSYGLW